MRKKIAKAAILLAGFGLGSSVGFTPGSIENTIYNSTDPTDPDYSNTTRIFFDGLGRNIRTVEEEGAGDIVTAISYDDAGRPIQTTKPYYSTVFRHTWNSMPYGGVVSEANNYYNGSAAARPNAFGVAFSETQYFPDPRQKNSAASNPGFNLSSGKVMKNWSFGISSPSFVANPTDATLNAMTNSANALYTLEVSRNEDNRFSQSIKDAFGRVIMTWSDPSASAGDEIVSMNTYDAADRLIKSQLPGMGGAVDPNMAMTHKYTSDGRHSQESYPDEGVTQYFYDLAGQMIASQDAKDAVGSSGMSFFSYFIYDESGRRIEEGRASTNSSIISNYLSRYYLNRSGFPYGLDGVTVTPKKRWYYDDLSAFDPQIKIPAGVSSYYNSNGRGKLVASISYNDEISAQSQVMKFYEYDGEGRVHIKSICIPEVPLQQFEYLYDLQGRLTIKFHYRNLQNGSQVSTITTGSDYYYDKKGRMTEASMDHAKPVNYSYETNGKLIKKDIGGLVAENRSYHIRDWLTAVDVKTEGASSNWLYREGLTYENGPSSSLNQYSGNVSSATHSYYNGSLLTSFSDWYAYDGANRLIAAANAPGYQESFVYDSKGKLTSKTENGVTKGPYTFNANTNQIARSTYTTATNPPSEYFYDAHGNLIYDRLKNMAIFYNYNNMPYRFRIYKDAPPEGAWLTYTNIKSDIDILYDVDGQRVLKRTVNH